MKRVGLCALVSLAASLVATQPVDLARELDGLPNELVEDLVRTRTHVEESIAQGLEPAEASQAWGNLGKIYHAQYMLQAAKEAYSHALGHAEDATWRYLVAIILLGEGDNQTAAGHLEQVVLSNPNYVPAWVRLAEIRIQEGRYEDAQASLDAARLLRSDSPAILIRLADVAFAGGHYEDAIEYLQRARTAAPDAGQIAYKLASSYRELGLAEQADEWLKRATNSTAPSIEDPLLVEIGSLSRNGRFYARAGDWAMSRGDIRGAMESYVNAVRLSPEILEYGVTLINMFFYAGLLEEAVAEAKRLVSFHIERDLAWYWLGWVLRASEQQTQYMEGIAAVRKAVELDDSDRNRNLLAAMEMAGGLYEAAQNNYFTLLERNQENAYYFYWFGLSRLAAQQCDGRDAIRRAIALRQDWGEAHLVLSRADSFCGDHEQAIQRIERLTKVKNDVDTRLAQAFLYANLNRFAEAEDLAKPELPHPDAQMIMNSIDANTKPERVFEIGSSWLIPPELEI